MAQESHIRIGRSCLVTLALAALGSLAWAANPISHDTLDIVVTDVAGAVDVHSAGVAQQPRLNSALALPSRIVTGQDGSLSLRQSRTSVSIAPDSDIEIPAAAHDGQLIARMIQHRGNAFYDVETRAVDRLRIETPFLVAVVKGTQFNVAVQRDTSTISLFEGSLEILSPDGAAVVQLEAGEIAIRSANDTVIRVVRMDEDALPTPDDGTAAARPLGVLQDDAALDVVAAVRGGALAGTESRIAVDLGTPLPVTSLDDSLATNVNLDKGVDLGLSGTSLGLETSVDLGAGSADIGLDAGLDLGAGSVDVGLDTGIDLGAGSVEVGLNTGIDLGAGSVDVGLDTGIDLGAGSVDVGLDTGVDLGGGSVDVGLDAGLDLGGATADLGLDSGVDLGAGSADIGLDAGLDLGGATADLGLDTGVDLGGASADLGLDAGLDLDGTSADLGVDTSVDLGDGGADLGIDTGLDLGGAVDLGIDASLDLGTDAGDLVIDPTIDLGGTGVDLGGSGPLGVVTEQTSGGGGLLNGIF